MAFVHDDLIVARPGSVGSGYTFTYTLASRLGDMLRKLEQRFGPRDLAYTILGIEFGGEVPQIWFPGNCRHVVVQLTPLSMSDVVRAVFQLAHESVHLLDPSVYESASVLEEGLATLFSLEYARTLQPHYESGEPKYDAAAQLASRLLAMRPDVVRHLRGQGMRFSTITAESMVKACPGLSWADASILCSNFVAWDGNA